MWPVSSLPLPPPQECPCSGDSTLHGAIRVVLKDIIRALKKPQGLMSVSSHHLLPCQLVTWPEKVAGELAFYSLLLL